MCKSSRFRSSSLTNVYLKSLFPVRDLPQSPSSTPFVDKENQQESHILLNDAPRLSTGKLNLPSPLATSGFASSSSAPLKRKSPSSSLCQLASLPYELPAFGNHATVFVGDRAATQPEFAMRRAAGTLVELKRPFLGSNMHDCESDEELGTPGTAQPSPLCEPTQSLLPRSLNPVARTLWNGGREVDSSESPKPIAADVHGTRAWEISPRLVRKHESSSSFSHSAGLDPSPVSGGRCLKPAGLATTPPGVDGRFVFRPQPKRLRLATY